MARACAYLILSSIHVACVTRPASWREGCNQQRRKPSSPFYPNETTFETVASLRIRFGGRKDDEMSLLPVSSAHASRSSSPANNIGGSMSRGGSSHGGTAAIRSRGKTALGKLKVLLRRSANFEQMVRVQDLVTVDSPGALGLGEARRAGS